MRVLALLESAPKQAFYDGQKIAAGTGYITMRDGTQLSYFATLPGPAADGPYPTVVNYSGYSPSKPGESIVGPDQAFYCDVIPVLCNAPADPSSMVAAVSGYATVNVNIRGGWAHVFIDGRQIDQTPLVGFEIPAGTHSIRVVNEAAGVDETKTITVTAGELSKVVF